AATTPGAPAPPPSPVIQRIGRPSLLSSARTPAAGAGGSPEASPAAPPPAAAPASADMTKRPARAARYDLGGAGTPPPGSPDANRAEAPPSRSSGIGAHQGQDTHALLQNAGNGVGSARTAPKTAQRSSIKMRPASGAPAQDPLIGKTIGGCRIETFLGRGGMG